jgi:hypothetical protein
LSVSRFRADSSMWSARNERWLMPSTYRPRVHGPDGRASGILSQLRCTRLHCE